MLALLSAALSRVVVLCSLAMLVTDSPYVNVVLQPVVTVLQVLVNAGIDHNDAMQASRGRKDSKAIQGIHATENAVLTPARPISIPSPKAAVAVAKRRHTHDVPVMSLDLCTLEELPAPMLSPSVSVCSSVSSASSIHTADFDLFVRRPSTPAVSRVESMVRQIENGQVKKMGPLRARGHSMSEHAASIRHRTFDVKPTIGEWEKRIAKERHPKPLSGLLKQSIHPTPSKSVPMTVCRKDRL